MLAETLKTLLATSYALSIKAQNFHWNVEGSNFPQYHAFFDMYYSDVYGSVDRIAEYIRTLDSYTPGSMARYGELSVIQEQTKIPRAKLMFAELYDNNQQMIDLLKICFSAANDHDEQGIANFIAERLDSHGKLGWQIRSILKTERE